MRSRVAALALLPLALVIGIAAVGSRWRRPLGAASASARSAPEQRAAAAPAAGRGPFFFVLAGGMVLDAEPKEDQAQGAPFLVPEHPGAGYWARRTLAEPLVPAAERAWVGGRVRLFSNTAALCVTTVSQLWLMSWIQPHFSTVQKWQGQGEGGEHGAPWAKSRIAAEVWTAGTHLLLGRLTPGPGCAGATWGRPADLPVPVIARATAADPAWTAIALAALRRLPAYLDIQKTYQANHDLQHERTQRWEDYATHTITVSRLRHAAVQLLAVTVEVSGEACSPDFSSKLRALWELQGDLPRPRLLPRGEPDHDAGAPTAAVDVDDDGAVDVLVPDGVLRARGAAFEATPAPSMPNLDCPC